MKTSLILALFIGLLIGSAVTYKVTKSSNSLRADEPHHSEDIQRNQTTDKANSTSINPDSAKETVTASKNNDSPVTTVSNNAPSENMQACFDRLKPSDIEEWQKRWSRTMDDFLSSNETFWNSKGNRSFDPRVIQSVKGKYKGRWNGLSNTRVEANFDIEIVTDVEGKINLSLFQKAGPDEGPINSRCSRDLLPKKDFGFDENQNAINVFMSNCNTEMLGNMYSQFAFKIPLGMQKGQQRSIEVSGLTEEFHWKSSGSLDLQKQ